jgi:hypothetical protein
MADAIDAKYRGKMNAVASVLDDFFNPDGSGRVVFTLLIAESGKIQGGRVNFISNGEREDIVSMLREFLGRVEGRVSPEAGRA